MSDDVKFIFKTLIKVPVIIFECYLVFNLFCFMFIFFKTLGVSYVVMQTVVENNYIPAQDYQKLEDYMSEMRAITFVTSANIVDGGNTRTQYGTVKEVGVLVNYEFQWPLRPDQQKDSGVAVDGLSPGNSGGAELDDYGHTKAWVVPIKITYKVPGLQYYPDLNIT